jgi:hypothetical protein
MAVQYEANTLSAMLCFLLESPVTALSSPREQALWNALLHTFLLAARSLIHFLFSHKPRANDMIAEDFFDDPAAWDKLRVGAAPEFKDGTLVNFISKRLAHLTWDRASGTKPTWGAFPIAWGIAETLHHFASGVEQRKIDKRLTEDVGLIRRVMHNIRNAHGGPQVPMGPLGTILPYDDFDLGLP